MLLYVFLQLSCLADQIFALKMGDILNAEYLPSTLMIEEAVVEKEAQHSYPNVSTEGEIRDAFATMQYHRSMMNEYLCRSYVADEILSELEPKTIQRLGIPMRKSIKNHRPQESLLKDQGSSLYRDWLSRSTLLDDVYRHYDTMMDHDNDADGSETDEMESGEVTGYAVQTGGGAAKSPASYGPSLYAVGGDYGGSHGGGSYPGHYQTGHSQGLPAYVQQSHGGGERRQNSREEHHYHYHDDSSESKGLAVKELFELALTALAFLAFGLFIMNLIMTCLMGTPATTVMTTQTTSTSSTAPAARYIHGFEGRSMQEDNVLNEMAYRVLTTVDNLKEMYKSPTQGRGKDKLVKSECFKYTLCQNNKYSRSLQGSKRLWLPMWSFGLSWLIGRLGEDRLSSLKASVLGLGDADCKTVYPSCKKASMR